MSLGDFEVIKRLGKYFRLSVLVPCKSKKQESKDSNGSKL